MAITRDAVTVASQGGNGASNHSFSHTVTGSNPALFVFTNDPGNGITGVTYNGVAMTQMVLKNGSGIGGTNYIYGMVGPATGTHTVTVTRSGTTGRITSGSASYVGVNQTGLPDAVNSNNASDTLAVTTLVDGAAAVMLGDSSGGGMTNGTNTTTLDNSFGGGQWAFYESATLTITPAGSYSMTAASGGGTRSRLVVAFDPVVWKPTASDSMSSTDVVRFYRIWIVIASDILHIISIYLISMADSISTSDGYVRTKIVTALRQLAKNIASIVNEIKH